MAKTLISRQAWRARLRPLLRDGGTSTTWGDQQLNEALGEALLLVQRYYAAYAEYGITTTAKRRNYVLIGAQGGAVARLGWVALFPLSVSPVAAPYRAHPLFLDSVIEDYRLWDLGAGHARQLVLSEDPGTGRTLAFGGEVETAGWASPEVVASGADLEIRDLYPAGTEDGGSVLLFLAAARTAAYRIAMQILDDGGGPEYQKLYTAALEEREGLARQIAHPRRRARITNGIF